MLANVLITQRVNCIEAGSARTTSAQKRASTGGGSVHAWASIAITFAVVDGDARLERGDFPRYIALHQRFPLAAVHARPFFFFWVAGRRAHKRCDPALCCGRCFVAGEHVMTGVENFLAIPHKRDGAAEAALALKVAYRTTAQMR
jgi:hypothetical protein